MLFFIIQHSLLGRDGCVLTTPSSFDEKGETVNYTYHLILRLAL
jgi:hypothetical protein